MTNAQVPFTADAQVTYKDILRPDDSVTGIRQDTGGAVLITGSYQGPVEQPPDNRKPQGLLYRGPLHPTEPRGYIFLTPKFPTQSVTTSVFYGPNTSLFDPSIGAGNLRAVGSYKYKQDGAKFDHGMMYQGSPDGSGTWTEINVPESATGGKTVAFTICHSTMGDLVVGNYDLKDVPESANAFIYHVKTGKYTIFNIGRLATAYGIWQNGGPNSSRYTIVGGVEAEQKINVGYLLDYDAASGAFSNLTYYNYNNQSDISTHFEGITAYGSGYSLAAEGVAKNAGAAFVTIYRNPNGSFGQATWVPVRNSNTKGISTGNSVLENNLVGIYEPGSGIQSYLAIVSF